MSTPCLTSIHDEHQELVVIYRQCDGYPEGHGEELAKFLNGFKIFDGDLDPRRVGKVANGADCLAAQVVAHFKTKPGHFYLQPAGTSDYGELYHYTVTAKPGEPVEIAITDTTQSHLLFKGTPEECLAWLKERDQKAA